MSCTGSVAVIADDGTPPPRIEDWLDRAALRIDELERRWSRFLDDSEITGLNRADGAPRRCSHDTLALVEAMVAGWHATDGSFDPSLLGPLVELGYANSRVDGSAAPALLPGTGYGRRVDLIRRDRAGSIVRLPPGLTLDPGGIGKGLAADLVTGELTVDGGAVGAIVEIGGDVRVRGVGPDDDAWTVAVVDPDGRAEYVRLRDGGIATSTTRLRTWRSGGEERHHLLDPSTGRPTGHTDRGDATDDVVACTVIAGTAAWAEVFTKPAFVEGAVRSLARYESHGLAARLTLADGSTVVTSRWKEFLA